MQVAARVLAGDVLYRDVTWMYGPLPVYLLSFFFRWLGIHTAAFMAVMQLLAVAGVLLTYRVARFLLPTWLALLGTVVMLAGGWWGGYISYALSYTGAIPLGAVLGLLFLVCLLSYLRYAPCTLLWGGRLWLLCAGLATGGAILTKPEFALACLGTGLLILTGIAVYPAGWAGTRRGALRGLAVYTIAAVASAGIGYGILAWRAGPADLWAGISAYEQDAILLAAWPPWGTPESRGTIVVGMGIWLGLAGLLMAGLARRRKHVLWAGVLALLGLTLALLPEWWRPFPGPHLLLYTVYGRGNPAPPAAAPRDSHIAALEQLLSAFWAPATTVLTGLILGLGILWLRARRRGRPLTPTTWIIMALCLYSALGDVRSYLYPTGTFHFHYLNTFFPVLLYPATYLLPGTTGWFEAPARGRRALAIVIGILVVYGLSGLVWTTSYLARMQTMLPSRRGPVLFYPSTSREPAQVEMMQYLLSHTHPGQTVVIVGHEPGFYFLAGLRNPLRQDTILPGMGSSPAEVQQILGRLAADPPALIIVPQSVVHGGGWFWDLPVGRVAYANLAPVWDWVAAHYRVRETVGAEPWGFTIYEPDDAAR